MPIALGATSSGIGTGATPSVTTQASGSTFLAFAADIYETFGTVTDSKGNTYTPLGAQQNWTLAGTGWTGNMRGWICENGTGGSGHTLSIAGSSADTQKYFIEVTGGLTSGALDINNFSTIGTTANPALSGSATPAQADEILVALCAGDFNPSAYSWNNSFTKIADLSPGSFIGSSTAYRVVSSITSYQASVNRTTANPSASMWFVSIKAASGGAVYNASITESMTLADSQGAVALIAATITEPLSLAETQTAAFIAVATVNESMTLADSQDASVTGGGTVYDVTIVEVMSLGDSASAAHVMPATISEALSLLDSQQTSQLFSAQATEAMALADSQVAANVITAAVTETITLTDSSAASAMLTAVMQELVSLDDSASTQMVANATTTEAMNLGDSAEAQGDEPVAPGAFSRTDERRRFT